MSTGFQFNKGPLSDGAMPRDWAQSTHEFGIHASETTQRFVYGTRYVTWDGKVWRYSLSTGACYTERGNYFANTISSDANGIDYSVLTNNQSIGDREVTLTNGSTAVAEDYFAGGLVVIIPTETVTDGQVMHRGIIGNTAAIATTGECTLYLDYPIDRAVTTSNYAYAMPSGFSNLLYGNTGGTKSIAGLAGAYVTASGYNFWCQTHGACQITNGGSSECGKTTYYRGCWWRHDGTIDIFTNIGTYVTDQLAGFVIDNNADANGATNIMMTNGY